MFPGASGTAARQPLSSGPRRLASEQCPREPRDGGAAAAAAVWFQGSLSHRPGLRQGGRDLRRSLRSGSRKQGAPPGLSRSRTVALGGRGGGAGWSAAPMDPRDSAGRPGPGSPWQPRAGRTPPEGCSRGICRLSHGGALFLPRSVTPVPASPRNRRPLAPLDRSVSRVVDLPGTASGSLSPHSPRTVPWKARILCRR